ELIRVEGRIEDGRRVARQLPAMKAERPWASIAERLSRIVAGGAALHVIAGKPLVEKQTTAELDPRVVRRVVGRHGHGGERADVTGQGPQLLEHLDREPERLVRRA